LAPDALDASTTEEQYSLLFQIFNRDVIILGDLNAYSTMFGASMTNCRGRLLEELMDEHNLVALNIGSGTYIRRTGEFSHLDIAMTNINIACIANWSVTNDTLGSDHLNQSINFIDERVKTTTDITQSQYKT